MDWIEFLGMEEEASKVFLACILLGCSIGIAVGHSMATGEKKSAGSTVLSTCCMIAAIIGLILGFFPAVSLFFTFAWGHLLTSLFSGACHGALWGFLCYSITLELRIRKYRKNPLMQEIVEFCKKNQVLAVQCFDDRVRLFTAIEDVDYCQSDFHCYQANDSRDANIYQSTWKRPDSWVAYDNAPSLVGTILFSQHGYPNVPDLEIFARALSTHLSRCRSVNHHRKMQYDTVSSSSGTTTVTHHTVILYNDYLVYHKPAAKALRKAKAAKAQSQTSQKSQGKTWE